MKYKYAFAVEHKNDFGDVTLTRHFYEIEGTGCFFEQSLPPNLIDYNNPTFIETAASRLAEHRKNVEAEWDEWKRNYRPPLILTPLGQTPNLIDTL